MFMWVQRSRKTHFKYYGDDEIYLLHALDAATTTRTYSATTATPLVLAATCHQYLKDCLVQTVATFFACVTQCYTIRLRLAV